MLPKNALIYNRFSDKDQSNGSLERQHLVNTNWCTNLSVTVIDTFNDDGFSAKTFDRPDFKKLIDFIKNHANIHYLVVAELSRFSRDTGEAITYVKKIQFTYGIKIVSAMRNIIYDVTDHASFMMMGLEFLYGNSENIKREADINGGIYTAKKEGRFIGSKAPYGFTKTTDRVKKLVIHPQQSKVVQYIFTQFLNGMPNKEIYTRAKQLGFTIKGNSAITKVLTNPIYIAQQKVKPWKGLPGGLFKVDVQPIIDSQTWYNVQAKLKTPVKKSTTLNDKYPLKNVLHCHCGRLLTAAPSRGKLGIYYDYYKCNSSKHTNVSTTFAHNQLQQVLAHLSLPQDIIEAVEERSKELLVEQLQENKTELISVTKQLADAKGKLVSVEEKFIANQLSPEAYNRWYTNLQQQIVYLQSQKQQLSTVNNEAFLLLDENLKDLTNLTQVYNDAELTDKQLLLNTVFDSRLYYQNKTYRTPYIMDIFKHNLLILSQKQLLFLDQKNQKSKKSLQVDPHTQLSNPLYSLLNIIKKIKAA